MSFFNFKKSVDGIIADIVQKIEDLHVVSAIHAAEAEAHSIAVTELSKLHVAAVNEAARAKSIAEKFTALIHV